MRRRAAKRRGFIAFVACFGALTSSLPGQAHAEQAFAPPRLFGPGGPLSPFPPGGPPPSAPAPTLQPVGAGGGGGWPVFGAVFNPALAPLGKWTVRVEAAPVRYVSLVADGSLLKIDFPNVPTIEGKSIELGVHVWPGGGGLRGFYVGPRYLYGKGDSTEATGTLTGWGFDVGYQLVLGHFALNLGAGVETGKLALSPKGDPSVLETIDPKLVDRLARESNETRVLPVATIGLGFAL